MILNHLHKSIKSVGFNDIHLAERARSSLFGQTSNEESSFGLTCIEPLIEDHLFFLQIKEQPNF